MDILTIGLMGAVFLFSASLVGTLYLGWSESRFAQKHIVKKRLLYLSAGGMHGHETLSLYKERALQDAGLLGKFLYKVPRISRLDRLLLRSKAPINASTFLLGSFSLGATGLLLGLRFFPHWGAALVLGLGLGGIPYLLLKSAERSFVKKFEEQLPEAMDFLARAMRSGHALSSAMEMVAKEMEDPICSEFAAAVDEIKFGLSIEDVLDNMCQRSSVADLRFFAISVVLNKETGGNITEVFNKISNLIRQRLQFRRQVQTLTAEGRFSAIVLLLLPVAMAFYVYMANFEYLSLLWTEKAGRMMVGSAVVAQVTGALIMKKMVKLEI